MIDTTVRRNVGGAKGQAAQDITPVPPSKARWVPAGGNEIAWSPVLSHTIGIKRSLNDLELLLDDACLEISHSENHTNDYGTC